MFIEKGREILVLDNKKKGIEYSGTGDLSVLILHNNTKEISEYSSGGLLLGLSPDGDYTNIEIKPDSNNEYIFFTDGIIYQETRTVKNFV